MSSLEQGLGEDKPYPTLKLCDIWGREGRSHATPSKLLEIPSVYIAT